MFSRGVSFENMTAGASVAEGDILAGKYRIEKILGRGAMGVVVAARHLKLDELVAIKFLLPETLANPEAVARFQREARAAVRIKSEHVARVGDVGTLENGAPFMVMEYLEGGDLEAWIEERGPLSTEQAIEFVLQALEAVAEAHALGIIHRDLKPSNLFWTPRADGLLSIKVLDFGISKITGTGATSDMSMTRTQDVMGSPLYMSPEQMRSARDVDAATDIWAIGVVLFELLTGKAPFVAPNMPELVLKIATGAPEPMRSMLPALPARLEQVILRCLEKDRAKRYGNVAELAADLVEFGPERARASADRIARIIRASGLSTKTATPRRLPVPSREASKIRESDTSPTRTQRSRAIVASALAVVAGGATVAAYFFSTSTPASNEGISPPAPAAAPPSTLPTISANAREPASPASADISSPALDERPATEPAETRLATPGTKVQLNPSTVAPPVRSIKGRPPPAALSSLPPGTTPPRAGSAYEDRK
jgi:eukaryotic-like serine/threonine-protein kinase